MGHLHDRLLGEGRQGPRFDDGAQKLVVEDVETEAERDGPLGPDARAEELRHRAHAQPDLGPREPTTTPIIGDEAGDEHGRAFPRELIAIARRRGNFDASGERPWFRGITRHSA